MCYVLYLITYCSPTKIQLIFTKYFLGHNIDVFFFTEDQIARIVVQHTTNSANKITNYTTNISVYNTRLQVLYIIYSYRSLLPSLLHHLSSHPLPSLHYLLVWCEDDSVVRALTTFLPHCTNLRTLHCERDRYSVVSESVEEEMWEIVVKRCRNLEEVRMRGHDSDVACDRLVSVMRKLSEREGIQAQKLRRIVREDWRTGEVIEDYTKQVKHLLPALQ